ncbi:ATP-binding protein [Mycolicibacterium septicum DSM 44393]|uniref:ATP-binding protein n=1 Tax=Mycolicibacterium septicum DSM 44393 TaxID=1341646 RepID=A0A7X6MQ12_9MYCO|nr:ATP-binding protein [Mycolicibacterium septicum]NKZ10754.1 ATP-binding protein [Mycolicibacterium septicum DSM 44393]
MDLSDYLERRYATDLLAVEQVQTQADGALATLKATKLGPKGWPYSLVDREQPAQPNTLSQSTVAMILHAMAVAHGVIKNSVLVPAVRTGTGVYRKGGDVRAILNTGLSALIGVLGAPADVLLDKAPLTKSTTWGPDDPLTLTWLYELLAAGIVDDEQAAPYRAAVGHLADIRLKQLIDQPRSMPLTPLATDERPVQHPFPVLRSVQLAKVAGAAQFPFLALSELPDVFLEQLHRELSNSAILDGGFDPASLVFSLEALMLINADTVSEAVVEKVVTVLGSSPSIGSHWRPVRPLSVTSQGRILLPQSVEVANSYLRVCDLHAARRPSAEPLFTRSFDLLQSYADWLLSRELRISVDMPGGAGKLFDGWQSEHTFERNTIHLWATSQAVLFLQHYSAMLQQHTARCARIAAGLNFARTPVRTEAQLTAIWADKVLQEPLAGLDAGNPLRAYDMINRYFVEPRRTNAGSRKGATSYSMLLYGPPGTGKTSFSENLAEALGYDMITISPSDFTQSGEAGVEQRAKRVFDVLQSQANTVILFDEIDRLLLDRDSKKYMSQETIFQMMTPSMLTKINDLRKSARSVFIIATNYAEDIDSAIKRTGRIDEQILLLPPDLTQRARIIRERAKEIVLPLDSDAVVRLARATPLGVFTELKHLVDAIADYVNDGGLLAESITRALDRRGATTINLNAYLTRFPKDDGGNFINVQRGPWKEFALLVYLKAEVGDFDLPAEYEAILNNSAMLDRLEEPVSSTLRALL